MIMIFIQANNLNLPDKCCSPAPIPTPTHILLYFPHFRLLKLTLLIVDTEVSIWLNVPRVLTSNNPLPQYVLVLPRGKTNSPPLGALLHYYNFSRPPPKAIPSQHSRTPSPTLVHSVMTTVLSYLPNPPSSCSNLSTRLSSPVGVNIQEPNYGAPCSDHNISLMSSFLSCQCQHSHRIT